MKDVQDVFNQQQEIKKEMKEIRKEYKDVLAQDAEYQALIEKIAELKIQKAGYEILAQKALGSRWEKFETLKDEAKAIKEMISDISLSNLMDGQTVEVRDEFDRLHEPVYNVSFKKVN